MGALPGYKWVTNPGLGDAQGAITAAQNRVQNTHSAGNRMGRAILHGAMSGTLENEIGDPFAAKAAAAKRAYTMDPLGDANHQRALQMLNDNMIDEGAGENFQNYAQGMVGHAMDTTTNFALGKMNTNAELAKAMADITLRGNTQQQTQGWLGAALGAVQAGAGIAKMFMPPT